MVMNATLPGATFGRGSCTDKFKIQPQRKYERARFKDCTVQKAVGFDAGEDYRRKKANDKVHCRTPKGYLDNLYPLMEWGWEREECKARIREAGLPVPPKSACFFCPNMKEHELLDLTPEERGRVMRIEVMAEPYNRKVGGLWRSVRKGDGRPASMTEYILEHGLEFVHPDDLEFMPLNAKCAKYRQGYTFEGPHEDKFRLRNTLGGCEWACVEAQFHDSDN
jgi:hypothetical protein